MNEHKKFPPGNLLLVKMLNKINNPWFLLNALIVCYIMPFLCFLSIFNICYTLCRDVCMLLVNERSGLCSYGDP